MTERESYGPHKAPQTPTTSTKPSMRPYPPKHNCPICGQAYRANTYDAHTGSRTHQAALAAAFER